MTEHRFRIGQKVQLMRGFPNQAAASGEYQVVRRLPHENGEFLYRVKSIRENHERVVKESELDKL